MTLAETERVKESDSFFNFFRRDGNVFATLFLDDGDYQRSDCIEHTFELGILFQNRIGIFLNLTNCLIRFFETPILDTNHPAFMLGLFTVFDYFFPIILQSRFSGHKPDDQSVDVIDIHMNSPL